MRISIEDMLCSYRTNSLDAAMRVSCLSHILKSSVSLMIKIKSVVLYLFVLGMNKAD
jgi:hypothetical protein